VLGRRLLQKLLLRHPQRQERIFRPDCQPELFLDLLPKRSNYLRAFRAFF
jgi:hypothetical protein